MENRIANRATVSAAAPSSGAKLSLVAAMNSLLDSEGYRKRFDELLGSRSPQVVSSIISMVNASPQLRDAFANAPVTVIQSALKAATFDLPIDQSLGYAYIVPFRNAGKMEAQFILGYKGMVQLALRTGAYKTINVLDIREGELRSFNRLTEEIDIEFVEDEAQRESLPIIGWAGYYKLINGTEKTIYMSRAQIESHEARNRKGANKTKGWRENFDDMAAKTVLRRLIGKWGLMSIDYHMQGSPAALAAADAISRGMLDDDDAQDAPDVQLPFVDDSQVDYSVEDDADNE